MSPQSKQRIVGFGRASAIKYSYCQGMPTYALINYLILTNLDNHIY